MAEKESDQVRQRRDKLAELRARGGTYPNDFRRDAEAGDLQERYRDVGAGELDTLAPRVAVAGRLMARRVMGKSSFADLQDGSGRIQVLVRRDELPHGVYAEFRRWDIGDIVGLRGTVFRTRTGELSVRAGEVRLLAKCLRPLPEKWHGLGDTELRYRRRYVDLITSESTRRTFRRRSQVIALTRSFFVERGFLEVETPMLQSLPGGAIARPFRTHHHALGMDMFLRVAPELNLKRLVVGGFERVFEINRNFRNEGVSTEHNPEFTMLEFYQAHADYEDMMDLTESLLREVAFRVTGSSALGYRGERIDLGRPFARTRLRDALLEHLPALDADTLEDEAASREAARALGVEVPEGAGRGRVWMALFEQRVEHRLRQPTCITAYPTEVSPLSRRSDADPFVTDRFELFIAGREIANGFSELNDPDEQAERFRAQAAARGAGDEEALHYDADYVRALEYGLPPSGGVGVGIDRLVMLLTDSASIRDVLLFPHLRPEGGG